MSSGQLESENVEIPATKVFIGNMSPGKTSTEFTRSLINLINADMVNGWNFWAGVIWSRSNVNITEKRNDMIRDFLKTEGEWLLMIDSDMVFPHDTIPRLLSAAHQADTKVVGGLCIVLDDKMGPYPTLFHMDTSFKSYLRTQLDYPEDAIIQVTGTGAACLMVHRDALQAVLAMQADNREWLDSIRDEHPILKELSMRGLINPPSLKYAWFSEHPVVQKIIGPDGSEIKEHWLGEDLDFCLRIGATGHSIYVDCSLQIGHDKSGRVWYPTDIKEGVGFRKPSIVAVIPVKDKLELTSDIVHQIRQHGNCNEIIVCDNGSGQKTRNWLESQKDITLIDCPDIGINAMWNRAVTYVLEKHDPRTHIAFLNNDLKLGDEFLERLSEALFRNSEMVAVSGNYDSRSYTADIQETIDICANRYDGTGGLAGFAFMVRGEWFASGYKFPEECMWWYGDNHLMTAIQIADKQTKDIPRKAGIVISAHVEHLDGGGGTAGDVEWTRFSEQVEKDRIAYEKIWKDYGENQFKQAYEYLCKANTDISEHLPTFVDLVEKLDAQKVIELGVRTGVSTIAWLYGLAKTGGHLWSVDISEKPQGINHDSWTFIRGDDLDDKTLDQLPTDADIVFVDTDHRYQLTKDEIAEYSKRIRPGGYMVFHDIAVKQFDHHPLGSEPLYPVRKAVTEWVEAEGLEIQTYENCYGLAVVTIP